MTRPIEGVGTSTAAFVGLDPGGTIDEPVGIDDDGWGTDEDAIWGALHAGSLRPALRSFFEEHGTDFSAQWAGKWKMVLQCAAAAVTLWRLWYYQFDATALRWDIAPSAWSTWLLRLTVWAAVAITVYSGWTYVQSAIRLVKRAAG